MKKAGKIRIKKAQRNQVELRYTSLDDMLPDGSQARVIVEFVEKLDLSELNDFLTTEGNVGRTPIDRHIILSLWLYAYSQGIGSGRHIARLCQSDIAFMWIAGQTNPNYHLLDDFRAQNGEIFSRLLSQSLAAMTHTGLLNVKNVGVDGTKIRAKAKASHFHRKPTIMEHLRAAKKHIKEVDLLAQTGDLTKREISAKKRAAVEKEKRCQRALKELQMLQDQKPESKKDDVRVSITDPESRQMKQGCGGGIHPGYNVQVASDIDTGVIVGIEVINEANDAHGLNHVIPQVEKNLPAPPDVVVVDGDYINFGHLKFLEGKSIGLCGARADRGRPAQNNKETSGSMFQAVEKEKKVICPSGKSFGAYFYREDDIGRIKVSFAVSQKECLGCKLLSTCHPKGYKRQKSLTIKTEYHEKLLLDYSRRMRTTKYTKLFKQRCKIELVNAVFKKRFGLTQFNVQTMIRVKAETFLMALGYNLLQWNRLSQAVN